jgi:phosphohistidine phosphatase
MRLYLVQHGEALSKDVDPGRALSDKGRAAVARLAAFLEGQLQVSAVVHSGKTRARQTAELLAAALAPGLPVEAVSGIKPNDAVEPFMQQITEAGKDTLVVGHLPFMAKLVARLVTDSEENAIAAYQPGSMVCLESENVSDNWQIQWMIRPDLLLGVVQK